MVSRSASAAAPFGNLLAAIGDGRASRAAMAAARGAGVTYFDTAPFYGHGLSEHRLGAVPARGRRGTRSCCRPRSAGCSGPTRPRRRPGRSRAAALRDRASTTPTTARCARSRTACSGSASRASTSCSSTTSTGSGRASDLERALRRSRWKAPIARSTSCARRASISAIGVGVNDPDMLLRYAARRRLRLLHARRPLHAARHHGVDALLPALRRDAASPSCSPRRSTPASWPPARAPARSTGTPMRRPRSWSACGGIEAVCARHGVPLAAAALQFPLAHPAMASVVVGMRSVRE